MDPHVVDDNRDLDLHSAGIDGADDESDWDRPLSQERTSITDFSFTARNVSVSKMEHKRTIIHFDIDCFYAQVEMLRNPELRNKPLGIQQKNIVVTTNYVARSCGVPKSSYVTEAKQICPDLVLVCGEDLTKYRQMSYQISEFLQKYTTRVERLGFDENFLDVSDLVAMRLKDGNYKQEFVGHLYDSSKQEINNALCRCGCELRLQIGSQIAADIRGALEKELGITCCAGISFNKLLAKLVAGTHKPSQQTTVLPHLALELMYSLTSVLGIPGIGFRTSCRLKLHGISSVQNLQASDRKLLEREFGPQLAQLMVQLSYGVDESPVIAFSQPQTLSDEDSFKCCNELIDAQHRTRDLLTSLLQRVVEDGRVPQTIRLTVRRVMNKYHRESKQCPIPANTFTKCLQDCASEAVVEQLMTLLMNLFHKLVDTSKPFHLTLISICFAKLVKPADQIENIEAFFSRVDAVSQHASVNRDFNVKVVDDPNDDSLCQSITKSSPLKSEVKTKHNDSAKTKKTIQHFFLKTNNETNAKLQNCDNTCEPHTPIDVSLPLDGAKERSVSNSPTNKMSSPLDRAAHSTDSSMSDHVLKAIVTDNPICGQAGNGSGFSIEVSRSYTNFELIKSSEETYFHLQNLLPAEVDAHTIVELPMGIQNEILLQYGIYVEELPQGRRFTKISNKIRTRSHKTQEMTTVRTRQDQHCPQKKSSTKRMSECILLGGETAVSIAKKKKTLVSEQEPGISFKIDQHLNVTEGEECSADIFSQNFKQMNARNDKLPGFTNMEDEQRHPDYVLAPIDQFMAEDNLDNHLASEKLGSTSDKSVFYCVSHYQHRTAPFVKCDVGTDYVDTDLVHNVSETFAAASHGPSSNKSVMSRPHPSQTTDLYNNNVPTLSSRRKVCHQKLPSNIDSEVFLSLPSNIRGEIMAHIVMGTSDTTSSQNIINAVQENQRNVNQIKKNKNQNSLLTYFSRSDTKPKKMV